MLHKLSIARLYEGDVMFDFVWTLKPQHHFDGISIMRCTKYDVTEGLGMKSTAATALHR